VAANQLRAAPPPAMPRRWSRHAMQLYVFSRNSPKKTTIRTAIDSTVRGIVRGGAARSWFAATTTCRDQLPYSRI